MATTRARIVAAALELLGTQGARALTHRRVDERAGLPEGSTSNHFRTRAALIAGASDGLVAQEMQELREVRAATSEELVEQTAQLIELLTGPLRVATTARHELFLEASREPALRAQISDAREGYVAGVVAVVAGLGATEPRIVAEALMATSEGLILHRVARHDESDPRPVLRAVLHGLLR